MIPVATTTITVTEPAAADEYAEPYSTPAAGQITAANVRAVIDYPAGREDVQGGEQAVWSFRLVCDPTPITRFSRITDERTGQQYQVVWVLAYPDHVEASIRYVEGVV
jgi:hypothetical protein